MNCLIVDDEEMSRATVEHFVNQTKMLNLVDICENATTASQVLSEEKIDLIFLDVEMPQMSGLDLLNSLNYCPKIIFITSKSEYAVDAFNFDVVDYLVKPVEYPRFLKSVNKAISQNKLGHNDNREIFVKSDLKLVRIHLDEVLYVEAMADYVVIHLEKNKHIVHSTTKAMVAKLPEDLFIRVHRSYIINVKQVKAVENNSIRMRNEAEIPLGASYKTKFISQLNFL